MEKKKKKWYSFDNMLTVVLVIFVVLMIVHPGVKATVIQGLMKVGLFQPKVAKENSQITTESNNDYSAVFHTAEGKIIDGEMLKNKVVFINFWATWCAPCLAELPSINKFYQQFKNNPDIVFLMIDADNDLQKSTSFMEKKNYDMPVVSAQGNIPTEWYSGTLPTTIVLDKNGNIRYRQTGAAEYSNKKFSKFIIDLINQN